MTETDTPALVSTDWLADNLTHETVRIVDGSWHMPQLNRDPKAEFADQHIPGARFFDIDAIADQSSDLPHMLPTAELFAKRVGALGIANHHHIIAYDATGVGSAARVWWTFRVFGHDRVSVLDGGLPKWLAEGRPTEAGQVDVASETFVARFEPSLVRSAGDILANVNSQREQVLDARAAGRFNGTEPEPRAGLRGGHIPGSFNLPFLSLYQGAPKTLKQADALAALYDASGIDRNKPIVTSCGSGVTACNLALGLYLAGTTDVAVYDGSWTEWGGRADTPIDT